MKSIRCFCGFYAAAVFLVVLRSASMELIQTEIEQAYCQSEYFRVKCQPDEVLLITQARYGRMRTSKCVKGNFGYVGCSADVISIMDAHCSGRRACNVRVLDDNFDNLKPCHDDLKSYLGVTYDCVKVITPERSLCQSLKPIIVTTQSGSLASLTSADTGCGTADAPWFIQLLPGQRVNLTLLDFSIAEANNSSLQQGASPAGQGVLPVGKIAGDVIIAPDRKSDSMMSHRGIADRPDITSVDRVGGVNQTLSIPGGRGDAMLSTTREKPARVLSDTKGPPSEGGVGLMEEVGGSKMCRVYAIIREPQGARSVTLCGGEARVRNAYVTLANTVEIRVIVGRTVKQVVSFMLRYQAIGCADVNSPPGGWVRRSGTVADFGCTDSSETWRLECRGAVWAGSSKNCTRAERIAAGIGETFNPLALPLGFSLIIIIALALAIGLLILAVGIVCLKRMRSDGLTDVYGSASACFTLGPSRFPSAPGRAQQPLADYCGSKPSLLGRSGDDALGSLPHQATLVHRVKAYGGPRPNTYACMQLLAAEGSPERHAGGVDCTGGTLRRCGDERGHYSVGGGFDDARCTALTTGLCEAAVNECFMQQNDAALNTKQHQQQQQQQQREQNSSLKAADVNLLPPGYGCCCHVVDHGFVIQPRCDVTSWEHGTLPVEDQFGERRGGAYECAKHKHSFAEAGEAPRSVRSQVECRENKDGTVDKANSRSSADLF